MDEINEGVGNPFDTPVPGQSLTDTPGNYPWEHPPQYEQTLMRLQIFFGKHYQTKNNCLEQTIGMLDAGVPVEAIARVLLFGGFMEGKFSPDVAFIITEPLMKMILSIGVKANVNNIRISMQDITNNSQRQSIAKTKMANQRFKEAVKDVQSDVKKGNTKGLMSKPETQGEN